jgi:hypothetical protein
MKKLFVIFLSLIAVTLSAQVRVATVDEKTVGTVTTAAASPSPDKQDLSEVLGRFTGHRYNYFEVNEDMFKAFCELENADSTSIALFKKIKSVKMLELVRTPKEQKLWEEGKLDDQPWDPQFYASVVTQLDTTGFTRLLKSKSTHSLALFLKKEHGTADSEFLLITDRMVIDIRGDIRIKTIYEMEEMLGIVQQILPN